MYRPRWQTLARVVIDDVQASEPAAIGQAVGHEVHRPALIRRRRNGANYPFCGRDALAATLTHAQACLVVKPPDPLVIRLPTFTAQQNMDAPIAVAPFERCYFLHALGQRYIARTLTFISEQRSRDAYQPAGPGDTHTALGHQRPDRFAFGLRACYFRLRRS